MPNAHRHRYLCLDHSQGYRRPTSLLGVYLHYVNQGTIRLSYFRSLRRLTLLRESMWTQLIRFTKCTRRNFPEVHRIASLIQADG